MTFRVFFCAGGCGLLPPGGRFGTNAASLPCPGDFFGTGTAWSSLTFPALFLRYFFGTGLSGAVCLLLHCSRESLYSRHCLGSLIFSTLSLKISLEWALVEGVCSPPYCRRRRIPRPDETSLLCALAIPVGRQSKAGLAPYGYA